MLQDESTQVMESSSSIELFNDLDLAVLGWDTIEKNTNFPMNHQTFSSSSSSDDYASYVKSLQQEYATEIFKKDRLKMLKTLLMIPNIFNNQKVRERFEAKARHNIQSEINDLQA